MGVSDQAGRAHDVVQASAAAIIGADERQRVERPQRIPPPPPIGIIGKTYLVIVAVSAVVSAADQFARAHVGLGIGALIAGVVGFGVRYGVVSGYHRSRWDDPAYRARYLAARGTPNDVQRLP